MTSQSHSAAAAAAAGTAVGGEGGRDLDAATTDHDGRATTCRPQVDYFPELGEQITCGQHVVARPSWSVPQQTVTGWLQVTDAASLGNTLTLLRDKPQGASESLAWADSRAELLWWKP